MDFGMLVGREQLLAPEDISRYVCRCEGIMSHVWTVDRLKE